MGGHHHHPHGSHTHGDHGHGHEPQAVLTREGICEDFHQPVDRQKERRLLTILIALNAFGMAIEIVGGLLTHSLALLSDAGHMFTHLFSILVAYFALVLSGRAKDSSMTFGYARMEILAGFFNGITVLSIVFLITIEAIRKIFQNPVVEVKEMVGVALFGLVINLFCAWLLAGRTKGDLNLRAVLIHLLSDTFSSLAILIGGAVIYYTNWYFVDPIASLIIAAIIAWWGWGLIKESSKILLQSVPAGIKTAEVIQAIQALPRVKRIYDVHIWELTPGRYVMTGHVLTEDLALSESNRILEEINVMVRERFAIGHTTFQMEVGK